MYSLFTHEGVATQQRLFNLRKLKKFGLPPKALTNVYRCTIESILSCCITAWYGNCTALNWKALQRVVRSAQRITGGKLSAPYDTYSTQCHRNAKKIIKGINPPSQLPIHTATTQKARSVQVHQSWDRETEKQFLSQGHQTAKQQSLLLAAAYIETQSLATLINGSLVTYTMHSK